MLLTTIDVVVVVKGTQWTPIDVVVVVKGTLWTPIDVVVVLKGMLLTTTTSTSSYPAVTATTG